MPRTTSGRDDRHRRSGSPEAITSIAVLPFKPLVAEGRDASLELGMADSLIMKLGSLRQVTVRPLSAVRGYTDLAQDAVKAGKELRVESVLDGHIQRLQDRIRVTVSLRRVRDGQQLWADQFDEHWTNIFAAQDLVSQRVAEALALTLTGEEQRQLAKRYTENPEAYEAYVRGRYFWNTGTAEGYRKAVEEFQRAIRLDPGYSLAFAGLADSYNLLGSYGAMPMREATRESQGGGAEGRRSGRSGRRSPHLARRDHRRLRLGMGESREAFRACHRLEATLCDGTRVVLGIPLVDGAARQGHSRGAAGARRRPGLAPCELARRAGPLQGAPVRCGDRTVPRDAPSGSGFR